MDNLLVAAAGVLSSYSARGFAENQQKTLEDRPSVTFSAQTKGQILMNQWLCQKDSAIQ